MFRDNSRTRERIRMKLSGIVYWFKAQVKFVAVNIGQGGEDERPPKSAKNIENKQVTNHLINES